MSKQSAKVKEIVEVSPEKKRVVAVILEIPVDLKMALDATCKEKKVTKTATITGLIKGWLAETNPKRAKALGIFLD